MKQNKSAKRSLAFSVLSLLLCCAMLVGTTFAWFTDSVTSGNNKIVAGNLDVELYHSNATVTDEQVTEKTLLFVQQLWEPGVAVFENFKVANEGTLALKYQLMVNFTNAVKTPAGKTLADVLKVGVVNGGVSGNRDAVVGAVETWEPLATFVLNGDLMATESDVYGIVIWWEPSDIDNEFNMNNENKGTVLTIDLGVSLIATQIDAESDSFGKDYDAATTLPELIQDNEELKNALTADVKDIVVTLTNDVTWDVAAWAQNAMGGASTETITINGNGYTINFNQTNSDWNNITAGDGIVLTINNANVTNSGHNDGPWNRHDLNFACEVVMNNVTSDKAMAFKNSATLNNVTIDDANTSDTYAIWVSPRTEGQTITLDNCVIDMLDCTDGRGIKIDNQYVAAENEKLVTLNVSNTTFKTEEKSAILVKTTLGANITLNNVDIANTLDPLHEVWVDEAAAAAYDLVTVTGGDKVLESTVAFPDNGTDLAGALKDGKDVYLGADVGIADTASRLTMNGGSFDGNGNTITYNGGMLTTGTSTMSAPVLTTKGGSISNLTVEASDNGRALYVTTLTEDLYVDNCVLSGAYSFNLNSNNVTDYTINFSNTVFKSWVSYANVVTVANFENCVFEGNLRPYADTVLTNCQFNGDGTLDLVKLASGETITLTGCTQNGAALTVAAIEAMQDGANMADYTVVENAGVITITRN